VTITLRTTDGAMLDWASTATFTADESGTVDTGAHAPTDGDYGGLDPLGLLWSMRPVGVKRATFFTRRLPSPLT